MCSLYVVEIAGEGNGCRVSDLLWVFPAELLQAFTEKKFAMSHDILASNPWAPADRWGDKCDEGIGHGDPLANHTLGEHFSMMVDGAHSSGGPIPNFGGISRDMMSLESDGPFYSVGPWPSREGPGAPGPDA
jgi:hypothetical protein